MTTVAFTLYIIMFPGSASGLRLPVAAAWVAPLAPRFEVFSRGLTRPSSERSHGVAISLWLGMIAPLAVGRWPLAVGRWPLAVQPSGHAHRESMPM